MEQWLIILNAAAGFYAASLWGFFAVIRVVTRRWWLAMADVLLAAASGMVGVAFLNVALEHHVPIRSLLWLVVPLLVLPASIHLASWARARRFIADTDPGEER